MFSKEFGQPLSLFWWILPQRHNTEVLWQRLSAWETKRLALCHTVMIKLQPTCNTQIHGTHQGCPPSGQWAATHSTTRRLLGCTSHRCLPTTITCEQPGAIPLHRQWEQTSYPLLFRQHSLPLGHMYNTGKPALLLPHGQSGYPQSCMQCPPAAQPCSLPRSEGRREEERGRKGGKGRAWYPSQPAAIGAMREVAAGGCILNPLRAGCGPQPPVGQLWYTPNQHFILETAVNQLGTSQ